MTDLEKKFPAGRRLEQLRKKLKLNQENFARELGISQPAISLYKKGGQVSLAVILKARDRFKVAEDWLKFGEGPMYKDGEIRADKVRETALDYDPTNRTQLVADLIREVKELVNTAPTSTLNALLSNVREFKKIKKDDDSA